MILNEKDMIFSRYDDVTLKRRGKIKRLAIKNILQTKQWLTLITSLK